jgi:hypothetical protein
VADAHDALVDLSAVVVASLTSAGDSEAHAGRVPGTDTGDLAETSVGLAGKTGDTPTADDTIVSVTTGGRADVDYLTLSEHLVHVDLLLEKGTSEVNLGVDVTTVHLHLEKISDLLTELELAHLGVGKHTHDLAVILDSLDLALDILGLLRILLGVLAEGLSLRSVPVLVKSALHLIREMGSPHSGEGAEAVGGLHVANKADRGHGRSLEDGNSLNSLLLVELGARALDLTDDVSHASLVADEGGKVGGLARVITRERANAASVVLGPLLGEVLEGAVTRLLKLTMRHIYLAEL